MKKRLLQSLKLRTLAFALALSLAVPAPIFAIEHAGASTAQEEILLDTEEIAAEDSENIEELSAVTAQESIEEENVEAETAEEAEDDERAEQTEIIEESEGASEAETEEVEELETLGETEAVEETEAAKETEALDETEAVEETDPIEETEAVEETEMVEETLPAETAAETLPVETAEETISAETVEEILPMETVEETLPAESVESVIPAETLKAAAVSFPNELKAIATTEGVRLTWESLDGASRYGVFSDGVEIAQLSGTSFTDSFVNSGEEYAYTITAYDSSGNVVKEQDTPAAEIVYLEAPLTHVPTNNRGGVRVSWDTVDGAGKYRIYKSVGKDISWELLTEVVASSKDTQIYVDDSVTESNTWYAYSVAAVTADRKYESARRGGRSVRYLAAPEIISANFTGTKTKVIWNTVEGGFKYRLYRKASGESEFTRLMDVVNKTDAETLSWVDAEIEAGNEYQYYVRCVSADGATPLSSYANVVTVIAGKKVTGITLPVSEKTISIGEKYVLKPVITPSDASKQTVTWTSKNPAAATVSATGTITGVSAGTATIVAKTDDGGFSASCRVTVRKRYSITYNVGNGTANSSNPTYYDVATPATTLKDASQKGYAFDGWYLDSAYKTRITQINGSRTGNLTLYAKWTPYNYKLTYTLNGGTLAKANPSTYTIETETFILNNPTRTGYTFDGWYTESNYQNRVYRIWKGTYGSKTLYAKWVVNKYTIVFKSNASDAYGSMNPLKCEYGKDYWLTQNGFTREGYIFGGWNTSPGGYGTSYSNHAKISNLSSVNNKEIILYAQWTIPQVTGLVAKASRYDQMRLTYDSVSHAEGYEIYRSKSAGGAFALVDTATSTSFYDKNLTEETTYYYKVRAYTTNDAGRRIYGAYSAVQKGKTAIKPKFAANMSTYHHGEYSNYATVHIQNTGTGMMTIGTGMVDVYHVYPYDGASYTSASLTSLSDNYIAPGAKGFMQLKMETSRYFSDGASVTFSFRYDDCFYIAVVTDKGTGIFK